MNCTKNFTKNGEKGFLQKCDFNKSSDPDCQRGEWKGIQHKGTEWNETETETETSH